MSISSHGVLSSQPRDQAPVFLIEGGCFTVWASTEATTALLAQTVQHLSTMRETRVWSLGQEDPLEKEIATHSSILAWKIHGLRSLVGYSPWGRKESDTTERLSLPFPIREALTLLTLLEIKKCWGFKQRKRKKNANTKTDENENQWCILQKIYTFKSFYYLKKNLKLNELISNLRN